MESYELPVHPDHRQARRSASRCAFATVVMSLIAYALMFAYSYLRTRIGIDFLSDADLALIANMVCTDLIAMPLAWLLLMHRMPKDAATPARTPLTLRNWLFYLPCAFVLMYAGAVTGRLIGALLGDGLADIVGEAIMPVHPLVTLVCTAVVGPVAEELFFRKAMIDRLSGFHPVTAILFSALLFALMHGNLTQFLYALPVGVLFGIIYYRTQNIGYTVLLHMAVNTIGGLVAQLVSQEREDVMYNGVKLFNWQDIIMLLYVPLVLGLLVTGVIFLIRYRRRFLPIPSDHPRYAKAFFVNTGWIIACAAFLGLFLFSEIAG